MNPRMWAHPATARNVARLHADGLRFVGPNAGAMAERGEFGPGRMAEPMEILAAIMETAAIEKILKHLGRPYKPPDIAPARYPEQTSLDF